MAPPSQPTCRFLFHQRNVFRANQHGGVPQHAHPFWQLEVVITGDVRICTPGTDHRLGAGEAILLPPTVEHSLSYHGATNEFVSVKFETVGVPTHRQALVLPAHPVAQVLTGAVAALCQAEDSRDPAWRAVLEGQLVLLLSWAWTPVTAPLGEDPAVAAVLALVGRLGGRRIGVTEVAAQVGLSPGRLGSRFRAVTGCGLKAYVDQASVQAAARLLEFSDFGIAVIAEQLGFTDQFTFSRFFHRVQGMSPSNWRGSRRR